MDIRDVKISGEDWQKFSPYIRDYNYNFNVNLGVSIILFDLNKEETTFQDIIELVKYYDTELVENNEIDSVYMWQEQLSSIDPIFFQKYAKEEYGVFIDDYQKQANYGAIYYCENFINELYEKMNKDGLFDKGE